MNHARQRQAVRTPVLPDLGQLDALRTTTNHLASFLSLVRSNSLFTPHAQDHPSLKVTLRFPHSANVSCLLCALLCYPLRASPQPSGALGPERTMGSPLVCACNQGDLQSAQHSLEPGVLGPGPALPRAVGVTLGKSLPN